MMNGADDRRASDNNLCFVSWRTVSKDRQSKFEYVLDCGTSRTMYKPRWPQQSNSLGAKASAAMDSAAEAGVGSCVGLVSAVA